MLSEINHARTYKARLHYRLFYVNRGLAYVINLSLFALKGNFLFDIKKLGYILITSHLNLMIC